MKGNIQEDFTENLDIPQISEELKTSTRCTTNN